MFIHIKIVKNQKAHKMSFVALSLQKIQITYLCKFNFSEQHVQLQAASIC